MFPPNKELTVRHNQDSRSKGWWKADRRGVWNFFFEINFVWGSERTIWVFQIIFFIFSFLSIFHNFFCFLTNIIYKGWMICFEFSVILSETRLRWNSWILSTCWQIESLRHRGNFTPNYSHFSLISQFSLFNFNIFLIF